MTEELVARGRVKKKKKKRRRDMEQAGGGYRVEKQLCV